MIRRALLTTSIVGALLLTSAGPAMAAESIPSGTWAGSRLYTSATSSCAGDICGVMQRTPGGLLGNTNTTVTAQLSFTDPGGDNPCAPPPSAQVQGEPQTNRAPFEISFACNGSYLVSARGTSTPGGAQSAIISKTVTVMRPPPTVQAVAWGPGSDRAIIISWSHGGQPADVTGYRVERQVDETWSELAALGSDATEYTDADPPAAGGPVPYRVTSVRNGMSSGGGETIAVVTPVPTTTVPPDPTDPTVPTIPGDPTDPTIPGNPTNPGNPGTPTRPGTPGGGTNRPSGVVVRAPRVGTPSQSFFPPLLSPPVDGDAGFSEELPFDEPEPGEEDAVLPDDELASSALGDLAGRGLMIPFATALLLAVWAFHLRYLANASRPQYLDEYGDLVD